MRVLITGAAGFIGSALVEALLARKTLQNRDGKEVLIEELVLVDISPPCASHRSDTVSIEYQQGDICDSLVRDKVLGRPVDIIFHLAATLTAEAQSDPSKGTRVNVRGFLDLLEACRAQARPPKLAFTSSIATFGGTLPEVVNDEVVQKPQTSYGTHKVIAEQLINDYSRHGIIDGRALRLPIVMVRPPSSSPSVSDQVAAIVREPLSGRDFTCPFKADTKLAVVSVGRVVDALIHIIEAPAVLFGETRALNLPALTVTPLEMIAAVKKAIGSGVGSVSFQHDQDAQEIVDSWPRHFVSHVALQAGLEPDASFDEIVEAYLKASHSNKKEQEDTNNG